MIYGFASVFYWNMGWWGLCTKLSYPNVGFVFYPIRIEVLYLNFSSTPWFVAIPIQGHLSMQCVQYYGSLSSARFIQCLINFKYFFEIPHSYHNR